MLMITTSHLPEGMAVQEVFPVVWAQKPIEVGGKGLLRQAKSLLRQAFEREGDEHAEAFAMLADAAPPEANAIIGIQVSTCTQAFRDRVLLFVTLIGTPALVTATEAAGEPAGDDAAAQQAAAAAG